MTPMDNEPRTSLPPEAAKRIGLRLVERGLLSAAEFVRALSAAAEKKLGLTDTLVGLGFLTEDQVAALIAEELGIPYESPHPGQIDPRLLARFPAELLLRYQAVPFAWADGRVTLATSEVPTLTSSKSFEAACLGRIAFSFGSRRQIARTLRTLLPQEPGRRPEGAAEDLDDPGAVGLLYRHLAQAVNEDADEVRFEPAGAEMIVQYRFGKRSEVRGRYAAGALLGLTARARVLIGTSPSAQSHDLIGTLVVRLGQKDVTLDVAITPARAGESVILRISRPVLSSSLPPEAAKAPDAVPLPAAAPAPASVAPRVDVASLLLFTKDAGGSDLHLSSGATPMVRVHGEMRKLTLSGGAEAPALGGDEIRGLVFELLTDSQKSRLEAERELDLSLTIGKDTRFRGNVFFQDRGLSAVFRVIPTQIKTCEELGLPSVVKGLADLEKGLILCTGPTGSGKSTTLAALVDHINTNRRGHILTIEDPIEFVHKPKSCMVNQREVGPNTHSFAKALRSALREDPDVILVGEMRDLETISLAITAAET